MTAKQQRESNLPFDVEQKRTSHEWLELAAENTRGIPDGWIALVISQMGNPSQEQWECIISWLYGTRLLLVLGGERGGKSFVSSFVLCLWLCPWKDDGSARFEPTNQESKKPLCWIIGPDFIQARAEFQYVHDFLVGIGTNDFQPIFDLSHPKSGSQPWSLETAWGVRIQTKTSNDIRKIASFAPQFVLIVEAHQQHPEIKRKAEGRVSQHKENGTIMLSGTLEDALPWYATLYEKWQTINWERGMSFSIPTWSNLAQYPGGWDDPAIAQLRGPDGGDDYFWERYGAIPRPSRLRVIPEFNERTHVVKLDFDERTPVHLFIDPAAHTYAVGFAQKIGPFVNVLDCIYMKNTIVHEVIEQVMNHRLWPYVDREAGSVIDIAGTYRAMGGQPQTEIWYNKAGIALHAVQVNRVRNLIETLRYRLSSRNNYGAPLLYFDWKMPNPELERDVAEAALSEFRLWQWPKRSGDVGAPRQPIDKNNDFLKALGYYLIYHYGVYHDKPPKREPKRMIKHFEHASPRSRQRVVV